MKILALFKHPPEYINFCIPEIKSLFGLHNIPPWEIFEFESPEVLELVKQKPYMLNKDLFPSFPYVYLKNHNHDLLKSVISRSLLLKSFIRVLSEGNSVEDLIQNVDKEECKDILESDDSFAFVVDPHNRTYTREEQIAIIDKFGALPFKGEIKLSNPKNIFVVYENWENDHKLGYNLKRAYFGQLICKGPKGRDFVTAGYELDKRAYLGPTSTDCNLSFLMANQAQIKEHDFVLDPFVGTGSLLIPPSHFKAICFGGEIDARVLQGYSVGRLNKKAPEEELKNQRTDIWLNFKQYGFALPEILRMDSSNQRLHKKGLFDAILCDPPYGWRACVRVQGDSEKKIIKKAAKKQKQASDKEEAKSEGTEVIKEQENEQQEQSSSKEEQVDVIEDKKEDDVEEKKNSDEPEKADDQQGEYFIATKVGKAEDVIQGLIRLADNMLRVGGRLVYLFPIDRFK